MSLYIFSGTGLRKLLDQRSTIPVASAMEAFLATGTIRSRSGLNLQQVH